MKHPISISIFITLVTIFISSPTYAKKVRTANVFADNVEVRQFAIRIEALGTLQPVEKVDLTVNDAGQIQKLHFIDGERVKASQVLVSLSQTEQSALVAAEQATVSEAAQQLRRMKRLIARNAVPQAEVDAAQRDLDNAQAQLDAVQARKADRLVVAPFDGVLGFRQVSLGAFLQPGDVVAHLVDDSAMHIDFTVPSNFIRHLNRSTPIQATTNDLPEQVFKGSIESIDNAIDPITRTVRVRAKLPNDQRILVAGMFMDVTLTANPRSVVAVPESAVQSLGPRNFIYIIDETVSPVVAKKIEVKLGTHHDGHFEVISGLNAGSLIVSDGIISVRDGGPVNIQSLSILGTKKETNLEGS